MAAGAPPTCSRALARARSCWPIGPMTVMRCAAPWPSKEPGPMSSPCRTGSTFPPSVLSCIATGTWSSASSTNLSASEPLPHATRSAPPTASPLSNSHQSVSGCEIMSRSPSTTLVGLIEGYSGLMENRSELIVDTRLTRVSGHAERLAALDMIAPLGDRSRAITLGADKGYDARDFVMELRELNVRPHSAQNSSGRRSAIDRRTTRHPGYGMSQRVRKRIEEAFGWIKTVAGLRKIRFRGLARVDLAFTLAAAAYNLVRLPKLLAGAAP